MALSIRKVNRDVVPDSGHKGRDRKPNDYDEHMVIYREADWTNDDGKVEWDGWNEVDGLTSEDLMNRALADLNNASNYKGVGVDKRHDVMAGKLWFRVRTRIAKPRLPKGNGTAEGTDSRSGTVHPVELKAADDAETPKRQRKAS